MKRYVDPAGNYNNSYTSESIIVNKQESLPVIAFKIPTGNTVTLQGYVAVMDEWIDIFSRTGSGWECVKVPNVTRVVVTGSDATANATWVAVEDL